MIEIRMHICGPTKCEGGHKWDGPEKHYPGGGTATCSKCGAWASNEAYWSDFDYLESPCDDNATSEKKP